MTERDENIICGVIVASFLDFNQKERLCALVRAAAQQLQGSAGGARGEADARERDAGTPQSTGVFTSEAQGILASQRATFDTENTAAEERIAAAVVPSPSAPPTTGNLSTMGIGPWAAPLTPRAEFELAIGTGKALADLSQECLRGIRNHLPFTSPVNGDPSPVADSPTTANCLDCGLDYGDFGIDTLLPRWQWLTIHPDEGGLLCANCIVKRASKLPGVIGLHATIGIAPENKKG